MSFWNLSDNTNATETGGEYAIGGGEPIPDGTTVLAAPYEAAWDNYEGLDYIAVNWTVLAPEEYKDRKIFQKLRVNEFDVKKSDKAKRMLAAIDANAGGGLMRSGEDPTNEALARCLVNKPMNLRLGLWEIEGKTGNWVQAVAPRAQQQSAPAATQKPNDAIPYSV